MKHGPEGILWTLLDILHIAWYPTRSPRNPLVINLASSLQRFRAYPQESGLIRSLKVPSHGAFANADGGQMEGEMMKAQNYTSRLTQMMLTSASLSLIPLLVSVYVHPCVCTGRGPNIRTPVRARSCMGTCTQAWKRMTMPMSEHRCMWRRV